MDKDYYQIILKNVAVNKGIGIHDHERTAPQKLLVSVEMTVPLDTIGVATSIHETVNYDPVRKFVVSWEKEPHSELIEDLLYELVEECFSDPKVAHVKASIRKTDIFPETEEAGVGMSVRREAWEGLRAMAKQKQG